MRVAPYASRSPARLLASPPTPRRRPTAPAAVWACPRCGAPMIIGLLLTARQLLRPGARLRYVVTADRLAASSRIRQTCPRTSVSSSVFASPIVPHDARRRSPSHRAVRAIEVASPCATPDRRRRSSTTAKSDLWLHSGRPASGFLQVSLSKVPRHRHRRHGPSWAEALPMNASDQAGPVFARELLLRLGIPVLQQRDRRGGAVQHRVDQEAAVGGDVVLPALPTRPRRRRRSAWERAPPARPARAWSR